MVTPASFAASGSSPLTRGTLRAVGAVRDGGRFIPAHAGNTAEALLPGAQRPVHPRSRGEHARRTRASCRDCGSSPLTRGTLALANQERQQSRFIPAHAGNTDAAELAQSSVAVHPRSRGEHCCASVGYCPSCGSSPLTRGTPVGRGRPWHGVRFIPAHAGNTSTRPPRPMDAAVHPRSRGEHIDALRPGRALIGSSPLTRGTPSPTALYLGRVRFIPAHAGNTVCRSTAASLAAVHPRSRGEHHCQPIDTIWQHGSSPLTRGTHQLYELKGSASRFIPAHAGNTANQVAPTGRTPVHPRSRGEHSNTKPRKDGQSGSSPLTRGTLNEELRERLNGRFIPAHAGNTHPRSHSVRFSTVHPRSRGEHLDMQSVRVVGDGSSPLTRGTRSLPRSRTERVRFIPAHAGNTALRSTTACCATVHPRSRGEHSRSISIRSGSTGSSPLTRGTRLYDRADLAADRFIPAHAGNTVADATTAAVTTVHPRSRGEHKSRQDYGGVSVGSSPLTRGTPVFGPGGATSERFIPAHAGNTRNMFDPARR